MEPSSTRWENWARLGARFIADGYHVIIFSSTNLGVTDTLRAIPRDVDPNFAHRLDNDRIQTSLLEAGTVRVQLGGAAGVGESLCHLAASAVMDADEKNVHS